MNLDSVLLRVAPLAVVLAATAFTTGCGSSVEGADDDGSGGGGIGDPCEEPFVGDCANGGTAVCDDGQWRCGYDASSSGSSSTGGGDACADGVNTCQAPLEELCDAAGEIVGCVEPGCEGGETPICPDGSFAVCAPGDAPRWTCGCPANQPPPGTACIDEGLQCEVPSGMDCGAATIDITCVDGVWVSITPRCSLPPCRDAGDAATCTDIGCRWLEPGCGDSPLAEAGCFEATPCSPDSCLFSDETCVSVSVEPACATQEPLCDSCSEQVDVCVPQPTGDDDAG